MKYKYYYYVAYSIKDGKTTYIKEENYDIYNTF